MLKAGVTWSQFWDLFNWQHVQILVVGWMLGVWTTRLYDLFKNKENK
jgi:hypothetical protein